MSNRKEKVQFWIVTGMSGAGKSQAINCFEDLGFFCVDNLPIALLPKMAELCAQSGEPLRRVALGIDIREGGFLRDLFSTIRNLRDRGVNCRIIFLDADNATLFRRFSETRRRHPLGGGVAEGIHEERRKLLKIKEVADKIIDTSRFTQSELKQAISKLLHVEQSNEIQVTVLSFGYKHGLPIDVDVVWDVRFMPNPNYVARLRPKTGRDRAVKNYVLKNPLTKRFCKQFFSLIGDSLPYYVREGKSYLTVAIGCTGGRHRSVALSEALRNYLQKRGYKAQVHHRDIDHA